MSNIKKRIEAIERKFVTNTQIDNKDEYLYSLSTLEVLALLRAIEKDINACPGKYTVTQQEGIKANKEALESEYNKLDGSISKGSEITAIQEQIKKGEFVVESQLLSFLSDESMGLIWIKRLQLDKQINQMGDAICYG